MTFYNLFTNSLIEIVLKTSKSEETNNLEYQKK